jgi:hypothetical protein
MQSAASKRRMSGYPRGSTSSNRAGQRWFQSGRQLPDLNGVTAHTHGGVRRILDHVEDRVAEGVSVKPYWIRRAVALPIYALALILDFAAGALGNLAAWIADDDWP